MYKYPISPHGETQIEERENKTKSTTTKTFSVRNGSHATLRAPVRLEKAAETKRTGLIGSLWWQTAQQREGKWTGGQLNRR